MDINISLTFINPYSAEDTEETGEKQEDLKKNLINPSYNQCKSSVQKKYKRNKKKKGSLNKKKKNNSKRKKKRTNRSINSIVKRKYEKEKKLRTNL